MMLRLLALSVATAACAEPVVEMELRLPKNAETFEASCVNAVSVRALGATIAQDSADFIGKCQTISAQNRLTGVHQAIKGKFALEIPQTGMAGIEIFGWSGPAPCDDIEFMTPDLIFHGFAPYIGQDTIEIPLTTTLDCAKQQVKIRPVELFTLVSGATPSSDSCAAATVADGQGWAGFGQIMERQLGAGVEFFGGLRGNDIAGGISAFSAATTGLSKTCLAYDTSSERGYATSCAIPGGKVCAGADEYDAPFIDRKIANEALTFDDSLVAKWDSMVFVSVWNNATPKQPIAGATVEVAPGEGQVVYIDPPMPGTTKLLRRTEQKTGASGLALVFTNKLADVKVSAGGATRDIVVAAPDFSTGAALVVMP